MTGRITRRRLLAGLAALPAGLAPARRAAGQTASPSPAPPVRIGLVVPPASVAAEQARMGAQLGMEEGNTFAEFFGKSLLMLVEEASGAEEAARKGAALVQKGSAVALVGGLDEPAARALREVVAQQPALFLNIGSRADELRGTACHRRMFHIQPSDAMYVDALGRWLVDQKKLARWAVLAADTPRGRALREAAAAVLARGGAAPVADERVPAGAGEAAFGEALGRSAKSGAQVIFLAMDSEGQLAAARAARRAGLTVPLAGPGLDPGEYLSRDLVGVAGFWSTLWYHEWTRFSARELNRRFRAQFGKPMQGLAWAGWAAVRLLAEAAVRAEEASPAAWERFFASDYPFDGHKGEQLTFRSWDHQLRVVFGIVSPRTPEKAKEEPDIYDTLTDSTPRDPAALDTPPPARRCRFES